MKAKKDYTKEELKFDFRKCKCGHIYLWHKTCGRCMRSFHKGGYDGSCKCKEFVENE